MVKLTNKSKKVIKANTLVIRHLHYGFMDLIIDFLLLIGFIL